MKKIFLLLGILCPLFFSCQKDEADVQENGSDKDDNGVVYGDGVRDYDGNFYKTVIIGDKEWMAADLKVIHYADGTPVPEVECNCFVCYGPYTWIIAVNNDTSGYNVQGICPDGWRLPDIDELLDFADLALEYSAVLLEPGFGPIKTWSVNQHSIDSSLVLDIWIWESQVSILPHPNYCPAQVRCLRDLP